MAPRNDDALTGRRGLTGSAIGLTLLVILGLAVITLSVVLVIMLNTPKETAKEVAKDLHPNQNQPLPPQTPGANPTPNPAPSDGGVKQPEPPKPLKAGGDGRDRGEIAMSIAVKMTGAIPVTKEGEMTPQQLASLRDSIAMKLTILPKENLQNIEKFIIENPTFIDMVVTTTAIQISIQRFSKAIDDLKLNKLKP